MFAAARFDLTNGDGTPILDRRGKQAKDVLPYTFGTLRGRLGRHFKAPPSPSPLYGLDRLAERPDAAVLMVEGEKAADSAAGGFPIMSR